MERLLKIYYYFLLFLVFIFGIYIRFEDIKLWKANEREFFYNGEPLYSEYDSFYFARYALDMEEGLFKPGKIDPFRFFPDNSSIAKLSKEEDFAPKYTLAGSFISYLFYWLQKMTGLSVAWLTYYLIPIFATSVVIPLFLYFSKLKLPLAGIIGGLVTVSAPMYFGRTCLMRLDHDVFNLTFPFLIAYFFYRFFNTSKIKAKYFWIGLASLCLILYHLWYAHPNLNFVLVFTFILAYFWEPLKNFLLRKPLNFSFKKRDFSYLALLILPQLWYLYTGPYHLYQQVITLVFNIERPTSVDLLFKDFPNIFMSISELSKLSFSDAIRAVIFNPVMGIVGLFGAFIVFLFYFRKLIFLFPFFGIGLLVFISGARFAMYLSPFIGIGIGFLVHFLFERVFPYLNLFTEERKQKIVVFLCGTIVLIVVLISQREVLGMSCTPKVDAELVKDMNWINKNLPKDAVIWSWWDYGYAFQLYARRAVFHDGGSQASPKTYFIARSFTTSDPKEGWLITSFVSNFGLSGLAKLLKEGLSAEEVVEKVKRGEFSKSISTPIFWVFTGDLIPKFAWIHYFGSYDFKRREGHFGQILAPLCRILEPTLLECPDLDNAKIDLTNGIITLPNKSIPLKTIYFYKTEGLQVKEFYPQGYTLEIISTKSNQLFLFILPSPVEKTLFNEMFLLRKYDPRYFELVYDNFPSMVVYKVNPE